MFTPETLASAIGRSGNGVGCVRASEGIVQLQLNDGNWYSVGDVLEYIHRHAKHLDVGDE